MDVCKLEKVLGLSDSKINALVAMSKLRYLESQYGDCFDN
jgi:hypothetical protein